MKRKIIYVTLACFLFCGCSEKAPELLTPIGEEGDFALVTKGELYDVETYDSTVTAEYENVKVSADGVIENIEVMIGDQVKAGQVLISMDTDGVGTQVESIDEQIKKAETENALMNQLAECDVQIAELEYQRAKDETDDPKIIYARENDLREAETDLANQKIEQQKNLATLQMNKLEGDVNQSSVVAPYDGVVCYLANVGAGDTVAAGTVVAVVAREQSKKLVGDYIETAVLNEAEQVYALINEKEYHVTNVAYDQFALASRTFWDLPLYSTFYFEDAPEIMEGMSASIVVIRNYLNEALQIPINALYSDAKGDYVYQVEAEEFKRIDIKVGARTETAVEVLEGLEEGDEVYVKP